MPTGAQVRGMLLEEAVLKLLERSGYSVIGEENVDLDPTLEEKRGAIHVHGRGELHQIDSIGDLEAPQPFSNPNRLLVEAKAYSKDRVGIDIVRNGVGVLQDIRQFYDGSGRESLRSWRYHYQYAIFSTTGFSPEAQRYAFAHDIPLIPLTSSHFFRPIRQALTDVVGELTDADYKLDIDLSLNELRSATRHLLHHGYTDQDVPPAIERFANTCRQYDGAFLVMIGDRFPVFLFPREGLSLADFWGEQWVRIRPRGKGWILQDETGQDLLTFDIPRVLLARYSSEDGSLSRQGAALMKERELRVFRGFVKNDEHLDIVTFRLDTDWLEQVRPEE